MNTQRDMMNTRRDFVKGAFGAAVLGAFGVPHLRALADGRRSNLRLGVITDIHVIYERLLSEKNPSWWGSVRSLRRTLQWFDAQKVDAVLISGDLAHNGFIFQLELVADAWNAVFPGNRAADGRPVAKLFTTGNHDMGSLPFASRLEPRYRAMTDAELAPLTFYNEPKRQWERIFNEEYRPISISEVKGYKFVKTHWMVKGSATRDFNPEIDAFYREHAGTFDPGRPFFHFQHPHPLNTCYGPNAVGPDAGRSTKALSAFPNAIAISGHSHMPLTDERSVWRGAFTSVGGGSLAFSGDPIYEFRPDGFENFGIGCHGKQAEDIRNSRLTPKIEDKYPCHQAMLWDVYDDRIVMMRREMESGLPFGDDWVLPLAAQGNCPFVFAERAKLPPQFSANGRITTELCTAKTRKGVARKALKVTVPAAIVRKEARCFRIELKIAGSDPKPLTVQLMAEGYDLPADHRDAASSTSCIIDLERLPKGDLKLTATPYNSFGLAGASISA